MSTDGNDAGQAGKVRPSPKSSLALPLRQGTLSVLPSHNSHPFVPLLASFVCVTVSSQLDLKFSEDVNHICLIFYLILSSFPGTLSESNKYLAKDVPCHTGSNAQRLETT